jgi:hypothetical protein
MKNDLSSTAVTYSDSSFDPPEECVWQKDDYWFYRMMCVYMQDSYDVGPFISKEAAEAHARTHPTSPGAPDLTAEELDKLTTEPHVTDQSEKNFEDHFGTCPHCHKISGILNVGRDHWLYCAEHKVKWHVGSNLFDSWRHQTEDEQRAIYHSKNFGSYEEVQPNMPLPDQLMWHSGGIL